MSVLLTDSDIAALIGESKQLPESYVSKLRLRAKPGHRERELEIVGANGSEFQIILRQSNFNVLDFSAILAYSPKSSSQVFRLRRYNGKSHEHTNKLEHQTFYDFHIHYATERYQHSGLREDAFAEVTGRYGDLLGATDCLLADCACIVPLLTTGQERLF